MGNNTTPTCTLRNLVQILCIYLLIFYIQSFLRKFRKQKLHLYEMHYFKFILGHRKQFYKQNHKRAFKFPLYFRYFK